MSIFFKIWNLTKVRGPSKLKGSHLVYKEILSRELIENTWKKFEDFIYGHWLIPIHSPQSLS